MPSYEAEQRIKRQTADEMAVRLKELEKRNKTKRPRTCRRKREGRNTKKMPAHLYATTRMKCEAFYANRTLHSVRKMCDACNYQMSTDEPVVDDPVTPDTPKEPQAEGLSNEMILIIIISGVAVAVTCGAIIVIKKKKGSR